MEAVPEARPSLSGVLLQVVRLLVLLVKNRVHIYKFLLLKFIFFNHWVSGLVQEAHGPSSRQAQQLLRGAACPVIQVVRAGLALIEIPVWLVVWVPRLVWAKVLACARSLGRYPRCLDVLEWMRLSVATWINLLWSCLQSLMLVMLLLLLLVWRLCRMAHRLSLGQLPRKALLECHMALKRICQWAENMATLTSWHLAYLVTWTTCLASLLLQAAFEHTTQLAQEAEPHEASRPLLVHSLPESLTPEAGPALSEPEVPRE
ncbi:PREDICTED: Williams-Beuren syndrome chromosomal region 28 protein [Chrysochloris asiatica]|uniref:Williams-Beuren syndrome chromosomal region 28 protein n=1 Tax=Chrysochloris asiatica TaxID=185453 RepID=A0A9B0TCE0_CHRAS|nr:PREDICTED: Williams-Beuren syndrome chromosomal region 28 protein [Chrysochloris asiatica]